MRTTYSHLTLAVIVTALVLSSCSTREPEPPAIQATATAPPQQPEQLAQPKQPPPSNLASKVDTPGLNLPFPMFGAQKLNVPRIEELPKSLSVEAENVL